MSEKGISDSIRARVARSVLTRNLGLKRGERVIVEAWSHTLPWAVAFAREARRLGAPTLVPYEDEGAYWQSADGPGAKVLGPPAVHEFAALGKTDVYLHMWGPGDRVRLASLPEKKRDALLSFNQPWYEAARKAGLRGARLEIGRPYPTLAKVYGVDQPAWLDQVVRGTLVDPRSLARAAATVSQTLRRGGRLTIRDDHGTDLKLRLLRRPTVAFTGTVPPASKRGRFGMLTTIPGGIVRAALDETVADGTIVANRTAYYDAGVVTGGTFHFANGRLTDVDFDRGGELFDEGYRVGGKGRDQPGMLAIGLNPELHDTPQLEDAERGAVMVSVGGNRQAGGRNPSPFFGWAITAGASVEVDGRPVRT
jgi:leucyl aminopeptidase (aminopeptidase T)